jgi:hypothetical protein
MTVIGNNARGPQDAATSLPPGKQRSSRMEALLRALTSSLDMAARGYLCAPLVECDPLVDPECTEAGVKLLVPESPSKSVRISIQMFASHGDVPSPSLHVTPHIQGDDA